MIILFLKMSIGRAHVLLAGPPGCGKTRYAMANMPADGVLVQDAARVVVNANATLYLETNRGRDAWARLPAYGSYFSKVLYWTSSDPTQEPEIITKTPKDEQRWRWFWGL